MVFFVGFRKKRKRTNKYATDMNSYPLFVEDFRRFLETQDLCTLFPISKSLSMINGWSYKKKELISGCPQNPEVCYNFTHKILQR